MYFVIEDTLSNANVGTFRAAHRTSEPSCLLLCFNIQCPAVPFCILTLVGFPFSLKMKFVGLWHA